MPKFNWKKFLLELARASLPLVITHVVPRLIAISEVGDVGDSDIEVVSNPNKVIYGRRATDTFDEAARLCH